MAAGPSATFKPRAIETDLFAVGGATPVGRQAAITAAAGDDATAVNAIIAVLEAFGLVEPN